MTEVISIPVRGDNFVWYVDLWYVRGIEEHMFPTKLQAEAAARARWPNEDPHARYARIGYTKYVDVNCTT
jgi:hypothetical protein